MLLYKWECPRCRGRIRGLRRLALALGACVICECGQKNVDLSKLPAEYRERNGPKRSL